MKKAPEFIQYELTEAELVEELQTVMKKRLNQEVVVTMLDWEDGDFTVYVGEESNSEQIIEKVEEIYGEASGGGLTELLLEELFGIETGFNDIKSYQEEGTFYISVRLSVFNRCKEAWLQADAIQETLDVMLNEQEAWDNREVLRDRALAVCKLIGDLVPEDMSEEEPIEDPRDITDEKDEVIII